MIEISIWPVSRGLPKVNKAKGIENLRRLSQQRNTTTSKAVAVISLYNNNIIDRSCRGLHSYCAYLCSLLV